MSTKNSIEHLLEVEKYYKTLDKILTHLSYNSPNCPSNIADTLGIKETNVYHYLSELLAMKYLKLAALDEDKYADSKMLMNRIRSTEENCKKIEGNLSLKEEEKINRKRDTWFKYFQELEKLNYSTALLCFITKEGKKSISSLV